MRAKRTRKPSRSLRYLLYVDRKLQRLSLKKVSTGFKRTRTTTRANRPKNAVVPTTPASAPPTSLAVRTQAIGLGAMGVIVAVAMIAAGPSTPAPVTSTARADVELAPAAPGSAPGGAPTKANLPAVTGIEAKPAVAPKAPSVGTSAKMTRPAVTGTIAPATKAAEPELHATAVGVVKPVVPPMASSVQAEVIDTAAVTITGCLEHRDDSFRLKDTSGAEAPTARSWKSGFLKKRATRIELIDTRNTLDLSSHVGHRVRATGVLVDREMRAHALRSVSASCN